MCNFDTYTKAVWVCASYKYILKHIKPIPILDGISPDAKLNTWEKPLPGKYQYQDFGMNSLHPTS